MTLRLQRVSDAARFAILSAALLLAASHTAAAVTCTVSTSGSSFGAYNPLPGQAGDTTGTISVTCSGTMGETPNYTIKISAGNGTFQARQMQSVDCTIYYNLYRDANRTEVWGDGTGGTLVVSDSYTLTSPSETRNYVVYGRITGGQYQLKARNYSDNILVTLSY